uniref:Ubiquitin carboxyl-terminal hydrolase n=2 Tax=Acrobeloides nanus TaxID=290746 RepID=A0A914DHB0_9BILA
MCCCMECATFGCLKHLKPHLKSHAHNFAISTDFGHIFCYHCDDFVYDKRIEKLRRDAQNLFHIKLGLNLRHDWNPGKNEAKIIKKSSPQIIRMGKYGTRGLRGLINLGNTCFMNCIIQTMMHIPMLRDYFLSDQHNCRYQSSDDEDNQCLMCEISHIFQEFYSGEKQPYVPHRMLHLVWTHAKQLAGYEQKDAHEFFISALNVLHKHSESLSMKVNPNECRCIIDRLFTGQLQSDLTCGKCGNVSTTVDPYWDISLELLTAHHDHSNNEKAEWTLEQCLANYVKPEYLGSSAKIKCEYCGTYEESTKQLTLLKLPIVACFHLKRFEHSMTSSRRKKIRNKIRYPEFIDLTPYTTSNRNGISSRTRTQEQLAQLSNRYTLIAVVNHNGTMESGHYTCHVRHQRDRWYKCDDGIITREKIDNVLASEGYLLFYCKMFIDYE